MGDRVKGGIFLRCDQHRRPDQGDQKIQFPDLDLGQTWLEDDPFSALRCKQFMNDAGTDNQNISFSQDIVLFSDIYGIDILYRHDYLKRCMPVRRIIFIFIVIIQADLGIGTIVCRFMDTTKMVNHNILLDIEKVAQIYFTKI